jgi:SAM-dependent methyltransferase
VKLVDKILQRWRFNKAARFIPLRARLVDAGTHKGEFFKHLGGRLEEGFGVDPLCKKERAESNYRVVNGFFPKVRPESGSWDAISLLAVIEHIPDDQYETLAKECHLLLKKGGFIIITVPSPRVDSILKILRVLRLIDGMSLEEHHGFDPAETEKIFSEPSFSLVHKERFQCGLNNLFVFRKQGG